MSGSSRTSARRSAAAPRAPLIPSPKLIGGRHGSDGLDAEKVAAIQRKRLRRALIQAAARRGCDTITVEAVCDIAGVSRRTLYERFPGGVRGCLRSTCETILIATARELHAELRDGESWPQRLHRCVETLLRTVAKNPAASRLVLLSGFDAPAESISPIIHGAELLEEELAECFADADAGEDPPPLVIKGVLLGIAHVARAHLLAGRERKLPARAAPLAEWACHCCAALAKESPSSPPPKEHTTPPGRLWWTAAFAAEAHGSQAEERAALLQACACLAVEQGRDHLQASRITLAAELPRGAFHAHFSDPQQCLTIAYEQLVGTMLKQTLATGARASKRGAPATLRLTADELLHRLSCDGALAQLAFSEILGAGEAGVAAQTRLLERFADQIAASNAAGLPPRVVLSASAGALWSTAGHLIASGRAARLTDNHRIFRRLAAPPPDGTQHPPPVGRKTPQRTRSHATEQAQEHCR